MRGVTSPLGAQVGFEALPVLLDLPGAVLLSWHAGDDPEAGIPVRLEGWWWTAGGVKLQFTVA